MLWCVFWQSWMGWDSMVYMSLAWFCSVQFGLDPSVFELVFLRFFGLEMRFRVWIFQSEFSETSCLSWIRLNESRRYYSLRIDKELKWSKKPTKKIIWTKHSVLPKLTTTPSSWHDSFVVIFSLEININHNL